MDDYRDDTGLISVQTFTDFLAVALAEYGDQARDELLEFAPVDTDDLASILYTSGTRITSYNVCYTKLLRATTAIVIQASANSF